MEINTKYVLTKKYILTLLGWLLCFTSNQQAMGFEIEPTLTIDKTEIDLCSSSQYEREFILTINLGQTIRREDSLCAAEIWVAYDRDKIQIIQLLTISSLFEGFTSPTITQVIPILGTYNYYKIDNAAVSPIFGRNVLVRVQGKLLDAVSEVGATELWVQYIFLGDEFKLSYNSKSDTAVLNAIAREMPDRQIAVKADAEEYKIKNISDELKIDYFLESQNTKNLKQIVCEFESVNADNSDNNDDIEIKSFEYISGEIFDYQILAHNKNKLTLELTLVKEEISNREPIGSLILKRNKSEHSEYNLKSNVVDVNLGSCSMVNDEQSLLVISEEDGNIVVDAQTDTDIEFLTQGRNLIIKSFARINKISLYTLTGSEILLDAASITDVFSIFENEKIIDLNGLKSGVYFLQINTDKKIKNTKLIIN